MLYRYRRPLLAGLALLVLFAAYEAYATYAFYGDLRAGRDILRGVAGRLDLQDLNMSEAEARATRDDFLKAGVHFESAQRHLGSDPLLNLAKLLPGLGRQAKGLDVLVDLGVESSHVGFAATDVLLAYATYEAPPGETSLQSGLDFLESQAAAMQRVDRGLRSLLQRRADLPAGLTGPLATAAESFDDATARLAKLVEGYNKAYDTLPSLLGRDGARSYLLLPQNDAELMPSGGLISSYGIATFDDARLESIEIEYFGTLFDRWQAESGGEYVEPPAPLKNYLKRDFSWGLGEAGWYPDFPTTADLARMFVARGGAPPTDGVIAIDQQFVQGLLELLGPVEVPAYDVVIDEHNLVETTLELTRDDQYEPGTPKKAFLSDLARALLSRVFAAPKEDWVDLLELFDRMARERHLQLNFEDEALQAIITEYGFDGAIETPAGDYVMLADASVNSTKLNIVIEQQMAVDVTLLADGSAETTVTYTVGSPYDQWQRGRDPDLMRQLMLDGVYGSYTRVYAPLGSRLQAVRLDGEAAGVEQNGEEVGKQAFGRFFSVLPGETRVLSVTYRTPAVVRQTAAGWIYDLYVQKEAGLPAIPLTLSVHLPAGSEPIEARLDGRQAGPLEGIVTDLATDRVLQVRFTGPAAAAAALD